MEIDRGLRIVGLVVEYVVATDVTRVRFPDDARVDKCPCRPSSPIENLSENQRSARLAQSVERQALNLMVVGSSPTVGVRNFEIQSKRK